MKVEYEVPMNNKKFIKRLAKENMRFEKIKTAVSIFSIGISVMLILTVVLIMLGAAEKHKMTQAGKAQLTMAITDLYQLEQLKIQPEVEWAGINAALGFSYQDGRTLNVLYEDKEQITKQERLSYEGEIPEKAHEIMLSKAYISYLKKDVRIGDNLELDITGAGQDEMFLVSGIIDTKSDNKNDFFVWVSEEKAIQLYEGELVPRTAYVRLNTDSYDMNVLANIGIDLAERIGIIKESVSPIMDYCVVMSGGDTGNIYTTVVPVAICVFTLAAIVVYSIFFTSIMKNVRGYGRLCTIGMTKRQIKQMVKYERNIYILWGILGGVLAGGVISFLVNIEGFRVKNYALASIIVALLMVLVIKVALHKPLKIAVSISPIESSKWIRANNSEYVSKNINSSVTPTKFGLINLRRNLKKTILTIFILSFGGILLIVTSTLAESLSARKMAEFYMFPFGDMQIRIQAVGKSTFTENAMEDRVSNLQRTQNPLNGKLIEELEKIEGIKKIRGENAVNLSIQYEGGIMATSGGTGGLTPVLNKTQCKAIDKALVSGSAEYDLLSKENGILLREGVADIQVGQKVLLEGTDKEGKEFQIEVPVIGIYNQNLQQEVIPLSSGSDFMVVDKTVHELTGITQLCGILTLDCDNELSVAIQQQLEYMCNQNDEIELYTIDESIGVREELFETKTQPLYLIALILFMFGIITLVNTSLTNLIVRKREFALLEAVGMTDRQIKNILLTEEFVYFAVATLITAIIGNLSGILICGYIEKRSHCINLNVPIEIFFIYLGSLILVEGIILWYAFAKMKKASIVEWLSIQE